MPHIPGHPAEDNNNNETGGLPYLMPDEVEEDSKIQSPENIKSTESMVAPGSGNATQFAQEIADLLGMEVQDPNKPLGKGFQKTYQTTSI